MGCVKLELLLVLPGIWQLFPFWLRQDQGETVYATFFSWFQMKIADIAAISYCILYLEILPVLSSCEETSCSYKGYKPWLGNPFLKQTYVVLIKIAMFTCSLLAYCVMEKWVTNFLPFCSQMVSCSYLLQCYSVLHYAKLRQMIKKVFVTLVS